MEPMQFATAILLALPLGAAAPPAHETPARVTQAATVIDRDAFNALNRTVVLELRKGE
jgi:hypothetical protein